MTNSHRAAVQPLVCQTYKFGQVIGDYAQAIAHLRVAEGALRFLRNGLADTYSHRPKVRIGALEAMVRAALLSRLDEDMAGLHRSSTASQAQAQAQAIQAFHRSFQEHSELIFGKIAPPWVGGCSERVETDSALSILGFAPLDEPSEKAPLPRAYAMARFNVARTEQRASVLFLLAELVRRGQSELPAPAQTEFEDASAAIFGARTLHISRMLSMGILLGQEALVECKAYVKDQYREGISIMELLEVDGVHPGQYLVSAEQKLRKALDKA